MVVVVVREVSVGRGFCSWSGSCEGDGASGSWKEAVGAESNGSGGSISEPGDLDDAPELVDNSGVSSAPTPERSDESVSGFSRSGSAMDNGFAGSHSGTAGTLSRHLRIHRASLCGPDGWRIISTVCARCDHVDCAVP